MTFLIIMQQFGDPYTEALPKDFPLQQIAIFFEKALPQSKQLIEDRELESERVNPQKNNTIIMDVQRTRSSFFGKEIKADMQKLLVHFCRLQKLDYKQGMNEILAPFIYIKNVGWSISRCYQLFRLFFDQYCLNFYYDKDFNSLEIIFKMVAVTIKYHDPALSRYLQNYQIEPQIYCIGWLMTLFASKLSLKMTYTLWQYMVSQKDEYFIFFIIIAIIINRREEIIQTKSASIFSIITNLIFKDEHELSNTIKIALLLRKTTPASLLLFFREHRIFKERNSFQRISYLLKQMDQVNLFLVGAMEISLKQHFKLGFCEKQCYFCSLKQPIKLHYPNTPLQTHFPTLHRLVALSNDIRTMEHSLDFILVDMRGDKSKKLPKVEGMRVFSISPDDMIQTTEAKFNEEFMESRGREHFLFLLNKFSFEKEESFSSQEFSSCQKVIKILNSYSYCYLSILEGGQSAYGTFLKELKLKSEILNSKLHPVSEYEQQVQSGTIIEQNDLIIGKEQVLQLSEVVTLHKMSIHNKLHIFQGEQNSMDYFLIITPYFLIWVERNGLLQRLVKFIKQRKSIISHIIEQQYVLRIPFKIVTMHSLFRVQKLTARVHHNNCLLFYLFEHKHQLSKKYHRGDRKSVWLSSAEQVVNEDLQFSSDLSKRRIAFDTMSYQVVKQISIVVKGCYRQMVRVKREMQEESKRFEQLNNNIIEECDFSRKQAKEVFLQADFDV